MTFRRIQQQEWLSQWKGWGSVEEEAAGKGLEGEAGVSGIPKVMWVRSQGRAQVPTRRRPARLRRPRWQDSKWLLPGMWG